MSFREASVFIADLQMFSVYPSLSSLISAPGRAQSGCSAIDKVEFGIWQTSGTLQSLKFLALRHITIDSAFSPPRAQ